MLLDRLDKRVLYPEQVSHSLGLSILGAIPAIKRNRAGEMPTEQAAQFIEAFRTIRVNLAHLFNTTGQITMTISSPSAGDGKSLTSSNLAVSFAVAGYRTILIDGDIRRGELHRMFSLDRKPGLLDYLQGEATLDEIVRPTNQPGLWVVPCGTRRQHGPELLGSSAMQRLLEDLRLRYNAVLVDSPPLAAGVDPFVLGSATGNLMLVLRAGETDRLLAEAKLSLVDRLPIRVLGAVLNNVRANDNAYRYYSYLSWFLSCGRAGACVPAGGWCGRGSRVTQALRRHDSRQPFVGDNVRAGLLTKQIAQGGGGTVQERRGFNRGASHIVDRTVSRHEGDLMGLSP